MKKLLILSGKGGTGKTTTASAFIHLAHARAFADVDVEVPNLHLVSDLSSNESAPQKIDYYASQKSYIDKDACVKCGLCFSHCQFNAISESEESFVVNPYACEGCGVCQIVCKHNAVTLEDDKAGEIFLYRQNENPTSDTLFVSAKLRMGRGNSGKLVSEVKKNLLKHAPDTDIAIIDGAPGIGCPVIASVNGVDLVLLVVEPSLSGMSDMKRLLKTLQILNTKSLVCINKFDTNLEKTAEIEEFCKENKIFFAGKIPYDKKVSIAVNAGHSIMEIDCPASRAFQDVFIKTYQQLKDTKLL